MEVKKRFGSPFPDRPDELDDKVLRNFGGIDPDPVPPPQTGRIAG